MVSLTAFRSLYGKERSKHSGKGYGHVVSSGRSGNSERKRPGEGAFGRQKNVAIVSRTDEDMEGSWPLAERNAWDREDEEIMMMDQVHRRP